MSGFPDGFEIDVGGQVFRPLRVQTHTKAGAAVVIPVVYWQTECADCGAVMELFTLLRFRHPRRRCDACAAPGKRVRPAGKRRAA